MNEKNIENIISNMELSICSDYGAGTSFLFAFSDNQELFARELIILFKKELGKYPEMSEIETITFLMDLSEEIDFFEETLISIKTEESKKINY